MTRMLYETLASCRRDKGISVLLLHIFSHDLKLLHFHHWLGLRILDLIQMIKHRLVLLWSEGRHKVLSVRFFVREGHCEGTLGLPHHRHELLGLWFLLLRNLMTGRFFISLQLLVL